MIKYCTNCGKELRGKVCQNCGAKENTVHKFCFWCGEPLDENAYVCIKCQEPISKKRNVLLTIFRWTLFLLFLICSMAAFTLSCISGGILFAIAAILLLPPIDKLIDTISHQIIRLRPIFYAGKVLCVLALALLGCVSFANAPSVPETYVVYKDLATSAAEVVFHEEVNLKNEESFVINDSEVTYKPYSNFDENEYYLVTVILDYSAQNGFGGMNRDLYTVKMVFDSSTGYYYRTTKDGKGTGTPIR